MTKTIIATILTLVMTLSCIINSNPDHQSSVASEDEVVAIENSAVATDTGFDEITDTDTSSTEDAAAATINLDEYTTDNNGIYNLTKEQALQFTKRVQLTEDNWQDYFDNRTIENYTFVGTNDLGEIEKRTETVHYFGVAENYDIVMYNDVRFEAKTQIGYCDGMCYQTQIRDDGRYFAYYEEGTEPTEWQKTENGTTFPMFATLDDNHCFLKTDDTHYADIEKVSGEVVLMDIPDELWGKYGETDIKEYIIINGCHISRYSDCGLLLKETYNFLFN